MYILFFLDNRGIDPPPDLKQAWCLFLRKADEVNLQLDGFEKMDRVELAYCQGDVEVRRVDAWLRVPKWTTPLVFTAFHTSSRPVSLNQAEQIRRTLAETLEAHLDGFSLYSHVISPTSQDMHSQF